MHSKGFASLWSCAGIGGVFCRGKGESSQAGETDPGPGSYPRPTMPLVLFSPLSPHIPHCLSLWGLGFLSTLCSV